MTNTEKFNDFNYITDGPILKAILKLALPIMASQLLQTLYNLVDTLWVGKVGAEAVAAISISFPLVFLMIAIGVGLTIAGTAIIAQYKGANNYDQIHRVLGQLFLFVEVISIVIGIIGFLLAEKMIVLMGAEPAIINEAAGYLKIIFAGMPFMFGFFIFSSTLRGIGDTVTPAIMMVVSVILNIILDPLLIFGVGFFPELGVQGAAVATIFSRTVVTIYALVLLVRGIKGLKLRLKYMVPDLEIIKMIIKVGIPSSVEQSMVALGQLFMTNLVASFGTMTLAAYGIVNRVINLPIILAFGISAASTTMVGQNIGADKEERAEKTSFISISTAFIGLTLIGLILVISPEMIISIFNKEPEVLKFGTEFLRIVGLTVGFTGVMYVGNGVFKGAGRTIPPMIISSLTLWVFRLILAYILIYTFKWQQFGLWWAVAISNIVGALIGVTWLKVTDWSDKIVDDRMIEPELVSDNE